MSKLVLVTFQSRDSYGVKNEKEYTFRTYDEVEIGDKVVVNTRHGLAVATIQGFPEESVAVARSKFQSLAEVVCRVDMTAFNERKEKAEKASAIKAEMDCKVKQMQEDAVYEMFAEKDPQLAELLKQYKELNPDD